MAGPAITTISALSQSLGQKYAAKISRQWQRRAITAALVPATAGSGSNAAFNVEFSGNLANTVAEGSDVADAEYASDVVPSAVFPWAIYRSAFKVSKQAVDAARSSAGIHSDALDDLFGEQIQSAGAKIATTINSDILNGTGVDASGNNTIVGLLAGALDTTSVYGGISRTTYSEWQGNVKASAGLLTTDLLRGMDTSIFTASGTEWTDLITSAGVQQKYADLLQATQRIVSDGSRQVAQGLGSANPMNFMGRPVHREAASMTGKAVFFNRNHIQVKYLPNRNTRQFNDLAPMDVNGSNGDETLDVTQIPANVYILAPTGSSIKVVVECTLQMCVTRPNAFGLITGISEV